MKRKLVRIILTLGLITVMCAGCDDDEVYENSEVAEEIETTEDNAYEDNITGGGTSASADNRESSFWDIFFGDDYDSDDYYDSDFSSFSGGTSTFRENFLNTSADDEVDADSFTLMVYMCGSNLETDYGAATSDLTEMVYGESGKNLNIVVETGGAKKWQNSIVSSNSLQRYHVTSDGIELLQDVGKGQITTAEQLSDFIKYATKQYPADRYGFIFWDHGGGTIGGYGGDENYNDAGMNIGDIKRGLEGGNTKFDFVGFDCCLMATVETANAVSGVTSFLIASEETEPCSGWYYTDFVSMIEKNPGESIRNIGKKIIDDYTSPSHTDSYNDLTLTLIDVKQTEDILDKLYSYLGNSNDYLISNGYAQLAKARNGARSYGNNDFEQIDMIDYIEKLDIKGGQELQDAIELAVIYNGTNMSGSNGLAMYYPYLYKDYFPDVVDIANSVGVDNDYYVEYFGNFISVETAGQQNGGNSNPYSSDDISDDEYEDIYEQYWYNDELADEYTDYYSYVDSDELEITEKNGYYVLQLSDEDWEVITDIELQVYVDDGEGYLALGANDSYEVDEDGDLVVEFDYNWFNINDSLVAYYPVLSGEYADGTMYWYGSIPAQLNESDDIDIWVYWEGDNQPVIMGYTLYSEGIGTASRGYNKFKNGDRIEFLFDYYDYDGEYQDSYVLEDNTLIFDKSEGIKLYYGELADCNTEILFRLKDIYQNEYYTEPIVYTMD